MSDPKYWAFISYSHRDKAWADWLHKGLETFVVPSRLIGRASRDEKVPARLYPIFRDREELPTSGNLGANIEEAIRGSRYLVVICSKASAASRWVDGEIRTFKATGKSDRVLCLIVDGEPNASDKAEGAAEECFAKSLRFKVTDGGALTEEPAEPIAADAREGQDGKENCLLKVAAGLLGVGFDELRQRDLERRRRARALAFAGAALIAGVLLWQERAKIVDLRRQLAQVDYERAKAFRETGRPDAAALLFAESNRVQPSVAARANASFYVRGTGLPSAIIPHSSAVVSTALGANGRRGAAGAADGAVRVWGYADGTSLGPPIALHQEAGRALAFSPDARLLAFGSDDGTGTLWDVEARRAVGSFAHEGPITAALFAPDGSRLATAGADKTVRLWDSARGASAGAPLAHPGPVRSLAFSPDGALLAAGCDDGSVKLWTAAGRPAAEPELKLGGAVLALGFSKDGKELVAIGADHSVRTWDVRTLRALGELRRFSPDLRPLALAPGAEAVLAASPDGSARLWDAALSRPIGPFLRHDGGIFAAAFTANGRTVATGGSDLSVRLFNARSQYAESRTPLEGLGKVALAAFSADGRRLAAAAAGKPARLWDTSTTKPLAELGPADSVSISADGAVVVTSTGEVVLAHRPGSTPQTRRVTDGVPRDFVAVSADGRVAVTFQHDVRMKDIRAMEAFDLVKGVGIAQRYVPGRTSEVYAAALSPDGSRLFFDYRTTDGNRAELVDTLTGEVIVSLGEQEDAVAAVGFAPGDRVAFTAGPNGLVRLWDARSGANIGRPLRHGDAIRHTVFSGGGEIAATAGDALPARLWDTATGEPLGAPIGPEGTPIKALGLDSKGWRLLALTEAGELLAWDIGWAAPGNDEELSDGAQLASARRLDERGDLEPLSRRQQAELLLKWVNAGGRP